MTNICRLIIPVDVNDANPNRLRTLRQKMRVTKYHRETARTAWIAAGKPKSTVPVIIDIIIRRGRTMDQGNIWAGLKHVIDGIFKKALTPDDSEKWLRLGRIEQQTGGKWRYAPEIEIVVAIAEPQKALSEFLDAGAGAGKGKSTKRLK